MAQGPVTLRNIPDIADIHTLLRILEFLGAKTEFAQNILRIDASALKNADIPHELVSKLRGLSAPLSAAGVRLQPDSVKRRLQGEYSATLRDRVGAVVVELVR